MEYFYAILLVAAGLVITFLFALAPVRKRRDRKRRQARMDALADSLRLAGCEARTLVTRGRYLNNRSVRGWRERHVDLVDLLHMRSDDLLVDPDAVEHLANCQYLMLDKDDFIERRNSKWVESEVAALGEWFDSIEKFPLTRRQREAVVGEEDNSLVVAGAGTGKTSTVVTKVGYVLKKKYARPEQILVLAFARKAKTELEQRIRERLGVRLEVRTFHSLGLSILGTADGRKPSLATVAEDDAALDRWLGSIVDTLFEDEKHHLLLRRFFAYYLRPTVNEFEYEKKADFYRRVRALTLRSLNGELVKSQSELLIANWLLLNGVNYKYEAEYPFDTATAQRRQYKPDFYLPEYDLYIEHFGVDRQGNTAPYVDRNSYHAQMSWKRKLHRKWGTTLIETYSYECWEGLLLEVLEERLHQHGVVPQPLTSGQFKDIVTSAGEIRPITRLFKTFLNLFKSHSTTVESLRSSALSLADWLRCTVFLDLFETVYEAYQDRLRQEGTIDFHDMIALATERVRGGKYRSPFACIIVDEFQDISQGRAELLKALLEQADDPRLFCVGDDWQSIFRFTGSDISLMTEFENHFGVTRRTDLDTTFRFNEQIQRVSTRFITTNPEQLKKDLKSHASSIGGRPGVKVLLAGYEESVDALLEETLENIAAESPGASVMVLGRYNHTLAEMPIALQRKHGDLSLFLHTVHKAKGLEEDYVIVLGVTSGKYGFPLEVVDDPLLDLLLAAAGGFPNAEERRLFYVALTRARQRVYLVSDERKRSSFIAELESEPYLGQVEFRGSNHEVAFCHVCGGRLVLRNGQYGSFWGCEHYPLCDGIGVLCPKCRRGTLIAAVDGGRCNVPSCDHLAQRCPQCQDGLMMPKEGKYGPFWRCSNYGECAFSRDR